MLSAIPLQIDAVGPAERDAQILRAGILAELDAINLYEQMAALANSEEIRKVLLDIAREEKTHVGEFQALLLARDREQDLELRAGAEEVKKLTSR